MNNELNFVILYFHRFICSSTNWIKNKLNWIFSFSGFLIISRWAECILGNSFFPTCHVKPRGTNTSRWRQMAWSIVDRYFIIYRLWWNGSKSTSGIPSPVSCLCYLDLNINNRLTLSLPAYHCRQWNSWRIYASPVAKGLNERNEQFCNTWDDFQTIAEIHKCGAVKSRPDFITRYEIHYPGFVRKRWSDIVEEKFPKWPPRWNNSFSWPRNEFY